MSLLRVSFVSFVSFVSYPMSPSPRPTTLPSKPEGYHIINVLITFLLSSLSHFARIISTHIRYPMKISLKLPQMDAPHAVCG
ncbi:hypothetical protein LI328DRAFT_93552 [Trichoderma asperelloides]|nr:hypothetical protein LI328DRAFT_93552 [Trichoderma asperelloides]